MDFILIIIGVIQLAVAYYFTHMLREDFRYNKSILNYFMGILIMFTLFLGVYLFSYGMFI